MIVTVYTTPNCPACKVTKLALDKLDIRYDVVDLAQHPRIQAALAGQGFAAAPVVKVKSKRHGDLAWSGFRRDLLAKIDPKLPIEAPE